MNEATLKGIGGWLLVYLLGPGVVGTISLVGTAQILWSALNRLDQTFLVAQIVANVAGIVLIFALKRPLTRWYHVIFNGAIAAYVISGPLDPETIGLFLAALVWAAYWIRSERVQHTFGGRKVA
jgi:hypothetical protein